MWKELIRLYSPTLAGTFQVCVSRISTLSVSQETTQNAAMKSKKVYVDLEGELLPHMLLQHGAVASELSGWEQAQWGFSLIVLLKHCYNICTYYR